VPNLAAAALQGFALGGGLILAIGAQNAFVLRQGLRREHVFTVAAICFLCDGALIALGCAGFASLLQLVPALPGIAAWGGAVFLLAYGARAFRAAWKPASLGSELRGTRNSWRRIAVTTLALSLLNPHVYLDTVILLGSVAAQLPDPARTAFGLGAVTASGLFFFSLAYGASLLAPWFARPATWRWLDLLVGLVMWTIAASLIAGQL
jgi:L-lysine exporter family protein LysE/ArgO